jgi:3-oxoacyl-[acyl-carrier protein] reductase
VGRDQRINLTGMVVVTQRVAREMVDTGLAESIDNPEFMEAYRQRLPLRRLGNPEDVGGTFAFLASDDAAFIHGETIVIDGGQLTD